MSVLVPKHYGFVPFGTIGNTINLVAASDLKAGDPVYVDANGLWEIATATTASLGGMCKDTCTAGETVAVYCDPLQMFVGQCDGTYAATMNLDTVDLKGSTGAFYIDENATTYEVLQILGMVDGETAGAHSMVIVRIARHQFSVGTTVLLTGDNSFTGDQTIVGDVSVTGAYAQTGAMVVTGAITSTTTVQGADLISTDDITCGDDLAVTGLATVGETLGVTGITTMAALLNANGGIKVDTNKFTVSTGGAITVASTSLLTGAVTMSGAATVGTTFQVTGAATLSAAATVGTTLGVTGITTLDGLCNADGGIAVDVNKFTVSALGAMVVASTSLLTGAVTMSASASVGTTLAVTGITSLTGLINADGGIAVGTTDFTVSAAGAVSAASLAVVGDFTVATTKLTVAAATGDTAIAGDLTLAGDLAIGGTKCAISVSTGSIDSEGTIHSDGAATIGGALTVTGLSTFNGGITADAGAFSVTDVSGNVASTGTLTIAGLSSLDGGIDVNSAAMTVSAAGAIATATSLAVGTTSTLAGAVSCTTSLAVGTTLNVTGVATLAGGVAGQGAHAVSYAAGANPTQAEYATLLDALVDMIGLVIT
jgi:hypothetical protein